jgi:hypothetical protein
MKQINVSLKNEPGALAQICDLLGKNGVNIVTLVGGGSGTETEGSITLITADEKTAQHVLDRAGYKTSSSDIMTVKLMDRPGELAKAAYKLAHAGVNIDNIYLLSSAKGETTLALKVNDEKKAAAALK